MIILLLLTFLGLITLFAEIFKFKRILFPIILVGMTVAFFLTAGLWNTNPAPLFGMMIFDNYAVDFSCLLIAITFIWFLMARSYFLQETSVTDHFGLILFSLLGAVIMVSFTNLTMLFLGIEILSISLYVLAASDKTNILSNEAGFKYFLMGSFATGFLLFGITLIYGVTGSFDLSSIHNQLVSKPVPGLALAGILLLLVGLGFKTSIAPFHFWSPDVYDGAPTTVTTYMATVVKTAAFAAFYRLFSTCFAELSSQWTNVFWWMIFFTLFIGNITAVRQVSVKRMLAYSSMAHAGFLAIAIMSLDGITSGRAIFYYTATYSIATITAFTVLYSISRHTGREDFGCFEGLSKTNPYLSFVLTISMLSLAGIPPTAGFFGKYYIFLSAIETHNLGIVIIALMAALIGVYYYFRIIVAVYFKPEHSVIAIPVGLMQLIVLFITTILTLIFGLFPDLLLRWM